MNNVVLDPLLNLHQQEPLPALGVHLTRIHSAAMDLRSVIAHEAQQLATEYEAKREALNMGFCALNLSIQVRNGGRSVQIYWVQYHFRHGKRTGSTMISKPKGSAAFDKQALKRNSPDWIHDLVLDIEDRARPLREALSKISEIERANRTAADRLGIVIDLNGNTQPKPTAPPSGSDSQPDDDANSFEEHD